MSTILAPESIATTAPASIARPMKTWLVGPWFDLLFMSNLFWPIVVLFALQGSALVNEPLNFFQIYFLSTPHRWITLVLVFCDSDRFWKEPGKFGGLALGLVGLGLALVALGNFVPAATDSLMLLMMLDYVWNAWHFGSQHAGISRIYGRMTRPELTPKQGEFEMMAIRTLVLWVFFRLAIHLGSNSPYAENVRFLVPYLQWLDPLAMIAPVILLAREITSVRPQHVGRLLYIVSVIVLYSAQLVAIRLESSDLMRGLFLAGAVFHAVEYLAVCNWSVQKKQSGIWHYQVTRTGLAVVVFMAVLGVTNWFIATQSQYLWALITLLVSLLHYGYDGIIWKGKPAPAK